MQYALCRTRDVCRALSGGFEEAQSGTRSGGNTNIPGLMSDMERTRTIVWDEAREKRTRTTGEGSAGCLIRQLSGTMANRLKKRGT